MRRTARVVFGLTAATLLSFGALFFSAFHTSAALNKSEIAGSSVRLQIGALGSCSATHIGGGRFVTAAHCVGHAPITVKTDTGAEAPAEALWSSKLYDIALLRAKDLKVRHANIDCRLAVPGTPVYAIGNPLGLEFIKTRGEIVSKELTGAVRVGGNEIWQERLVVDITIAPGSSGGGLFNEQDWLVGVTVGVYGGYRYGIVVPSTTVCQLLGR